MDDYVAKTIQAYDTDPQKYEAATKDRTPLIDFEEFMKLLPSNDLPVLDAGCAFGRDSILISQHGRKVIGIDMSTGLLKRARQLYPELDFRQMDIRKLDLDGNSLAGIWCQATLLHLNDVDLLRALKEFHRVLAPGGVASISFKEGVGEKEVVELFSADSARYYNLQTMGTLRPIVESAGLVVLKIYVINGRKRYGADRRDLNWVYCFCRKPV